MKIIPSGNGGDGHTAGLPVLAVAFSPSGDTLVSTSQDRTLCQSLVPADLSQAARKSTRQHAHRTNCIAFHPNGSTLAAGQSDGAIQFWTPGDNLVEADRIADAHTGSVLQIAFASDGQRFASAGEDNKVVMWDAATNSPIWSNTLPSSPDRVAFSPNDSLIGVCNGGELIFITAETGAGDSMRTAAAPIRAVAFQRNHNQLIAYGGDAGATVIERNGTILTTLNAPLPIRRLEFEPAGRLLAIAFGNENSAGGIERWPAESTSFHALFDRNTGPFSHLPNAYAISSSLNRLAVGTRAGEVQIF